MKKNYHHGNLKNELIKEGINTINSIGEEKLSLRKLAEICGVSAAAPYTYFKKKSDLLEAMSSYIWDILAAKLEITVEKYKNNDDLLVKLGKTYIMFFYKNPAYYHFIISKKNTKINFSLEITEKENENALNILKREAIKVFEKINMPKKIMENKIIAMWALVQGLTTIIIMRNKECPEDWEEKIEEIIKSSFITYYK
ncbi:TetR/AcrR family transcriptional regulator [Leptotrichia sp. OH3620_COT-345]|uniref:TetR/AcrR family transcriptional regulator n=1 Tax=Leptotrichia sp. OH3620_COT-345 TaxID=2491048 RepID=UPI000F6525C7|nr:TetR/AcrR family transcriptional regulator [Leptotrichia sp. OH3620_COT-345]RRD39148.1 TetR/AcrR family transcriptional regulator [Leptotrichia sp. OH3620_COT-345]